MKQKIRKKSSLSLISVEFKTKFDVMNSMKLKRFIKFVRGQHRASHMSVM